MAEDCDQYATKANEHECCAGSAVTGVTLVDEKALGLAVQQERHRIWRFRSDDFEIAACGVVEPGYHAADEGEFDDSIDHEGRERQMNEPAWECHCLVILFADVAGGRRE